MPNPCSVCPLAAICLIGDVVRCFACDCGKKSVLTRNHGYFKVDFIHCKATPRVSWRCDACAAKELAYGGRAVEKSKLKPAEPQPKKQKGRSRPNQHI